MVMFPKRNIQRVVLLFLAFTLTFASAVHLLGRQYASGASSSSIDSLQKEYDTLEKQRKELAEDIEQAQEEQLAEKEQLAVLEEQIVVIKNQVENLFDQIYTLEASISQKNIEIEEKQEQVNTRYELFKSRLRAMYIEGNISSLELLFSSEGFSEFLTNVEYTKRISQHDNDLIEKLLTEKQELQELKDAFSQEYEKLLLAKSELESKQAELDAAYSESEERLNALEETEKSLVVEQDVTSAQQEKVEKEILQAIEAARIKAEEEAKAAAAAAKSSSGGSTSSSNSNGSTTSTSSSGFIWPTPGYTTITSPYGPRVNPVSGVYKLHAGIDISGSGINGTNIIASKDGTVILVGWDSGGYGNYVMVDHGGGMVTLYAHCSQILVSNGQTVAKGAAIAKVGSTGASTGPHLHFEVRVNGQTTDPLNYVSP